MSMIFLAKGTCSLGRTTRDKDGNILKSTPAQFTFDSAGGCVAVGLLDTKTMTPIEPITAVFGDWDAAGYLGMALHILKPDRPVNVPDFKAIAQAAYRKNGECLFCEYCQSINCGDCIVKEWEGDLE